MILFSRYSKRLLLISGLLLGLSFSSCQDEEDAIVITASDFEMTIVENPTLGEVLGDVEVTTNRGAVTFSMGESNDFDGAFAVNATTGELTVAHETYFDFEETNEVTGTVIVTNGDVTEEVSIRISVTNINEITMDDLSTSMLENADANEIIFVLSASTTNEGGITYELMNVTPANALVLGISEGANVVKVNNESLYNFELHSTITATVRASSTYGNDFVDATITITLTDVSETVQERLDDGETPKQIYDSNNALLSGLYGKLYGGGIIASFNITDGTGIILAENELADGPFTQAEANAAASSLVLNGFDDWKLPVESEGNAMCNTLAGNNNLFTPMGVSYWGNSFCCGGGGAYNFYFSNSACGSGHSPVSGTMAARPIRTF